MVGKLESVRGQLEKVGSPWRTRNSKGSWENENVKRLRANNNTKRLHKRCYKRETRVPEQLSQDKRSPASMLQTRPTLNLRYINLQG